MDSPSQARTASTDDGRQADQADHGRQGEWPFGRARHGGVDQVPLPPHKTSGGLWLAGKRFVGPHPEEALSEVGADRMVCLCERHELEERYPRYVQWLHENLDADGSVALDSRITAASASGGVAGGRAMWFPVPDLHAPPLDAAVSFLDRVTGMLRRGEVMLMHCGAGIGRAGTLAAGILIWLGTDLASAKQVVAASRPLAGPEAGAQDELLIELEGVRTSRREPDPV
jgi:hypothetical protein